MDCTLRTLTPEEEAQDTIDRFHAYWEALSWTDEFFEHVYGADLYRWARKHNERSIVNSELEAKLFEGFHIDEAGCWIWDKTRAEAGYGQFSKGSKWVLAHRASYSMFKGDIPDDLEIDHLCRVRACCNPDHLEAVTHAVNMSRGSRAMQTHCLRGHEFSPENTYLTPDGHRHCRSCQGIRAKQKKQRISQTSA